MEDLGGPGVHGRQRRLPARRRRTTAPRRAGPRAARPAAADGSAASRRSPRRPARRRRPGAAGPDEARKVYDVRDVVAAIVDGGQLLELSPRWAPNMVTALARIEGRPVGVIANQPRRLGGVIDAAAAEKAALFVDACDRFGLPLRRPRRHARLHARARARRRPG